MTWREPIWPIPEGASGLVYIAETRPDDPVDLAGDQFVEHDDAGLGRDERVDAPARRGEPRVQLLRELPPEVRAFDDDARERTYLVHWQGTVDGQREWSPTFEFSSLEDALLWGEALTSRLTIRFHAAGSVHTFEVR